MDSAAEQVLDSNFSFVVGNFQEYLYSQVERRPTLEMLKSSS